MAFRQDLSQANNGTLIGRGGNVQQLGLAALRRLQSMGVVGSGAGQPPGTVPLMPGVGPVGHDIPTGPNPATPSNSPWGGGPQSLGAQGIQPALDYHNIDLGWDGGGQLPGDQLQTMIAHEQPYQMPGAGGMLQRPDIQAAIRGIRAQLGNTKPGMPAGGGGTPWMPPTPGGPNTQFKPKPQGPQPPPIIGTPPGGLATKPVVPGRPSPMVPNEPAQGGTGTGGTNTAGGAQLPNPATEMLKKRMSSATGRDGTAYY